MICTRRRLALLFTVLLLGAAACSSDASTRTDTAGDGPTTTAAPVTAPSTIPEGVTLRVGDQLDYLKTVLQLSGEDQDLDYEVEYSAFVGGPPMLQAFQADAIDTGFVFSTPLIFAQAAGQPIKAVAAWAPEHGSYGLVIAPGKDEIKDWADLKGKKVAFQTGTALEAVVLQNLDEAGLTLADITPVDLPATQVSTALQSGSADACVLTEPLTSAYLGSNPTAAEVAKSEAITDRTSFLIASESALGDPGKSAALADYIQRLVRAYDYLEDHQDEVAKAVYVDTYGLTPERAAELSETSGVTSFIELPGDVLAQQQKLADLFHANGVIPEEIDVGQEFDTRFNDLVKESASS
jgi:sulfonate transport system substrate-binding protein